MEAEVVREELMKGLTTGGGGTEEANCTVSDYSEQHLSHAMEIFVSSKIVF